MVALFKASVRPGDAPAILYLTTVEPIAEVEGVPRTGPLAHGSHDGG
ncbi:MAG: hypothetical protein AAF264_12610 [Pseudomonadota bacterium]